MSFAERAPQFTGRGSGPRAGFWTRFAAAFIDGLLLAVLAALLSAALKTVGSAAGLVIEAAYFTYFEGGPRGQTPGKRAMGIRVISLADGQPIGYQRAFIRWIGRFVSAVCIFVGYLWMLWDPERQCWHDKFAGDVVVPVSAYPPPM